MDYSENKGESETGLGGRLSWKDVYPDEVLRKSAEFEAYFFREKERKLRKERAKSAYFTTKTLK